MVVDFEFFSEEPLENVITCLKEKVDKVYYVGSKKKIEKNRENLEEILRDVVGIKSVEYIYADIFNVRETCSVIEEAVKKEIAKGNKCFMEITGGEDVFLVIAGMLVERLDLPVKFCDLSKNGNRETLIRGIKGVYTEGNEVYLDVTEFLKLQGACINYAEQKDYKSKLYEGDNVFVRMVKDLWKICRRHTSEWNDICNKFAVCNNFLDNLKVTIPYGKDIQNPNERNMNRSMAMRLTSVVNELKMKGYVTNVENTKEYFSFEYTNDEVRELLSDAGCILELYTGLMAIEGRLFDDCKVGVPVDWDGVIHEKGTIRDVENEIDVFLMKNNVPIFISCKNGKYSKEALYELDAVANKIGGRYAKKILIATQVSNDETFLERAKEMKIHVLGREIVTADEGEFKRMLRNVCNR